jgi:hypothetical protein
MRSGHNYGDSKEWAAPTGYGVNVERPTVGFYKLKLSRGTVLRAVHLWYGPPADPVTGEELDRSWRWQAMLDDGALIDFERVWPVCAGDPITEQEFKRCVARVEWARQHAPASGYAHRGRRRDPLSLSEPLPF